MASDHGRLECAAIGPVRVLRARGREAINELPRFVVEVLSDDPNVDLEAVIGAPAELAFDDERVGDLRSLALVVIEAAFVGGTYVDGFAYELELSSPAWFLTQRSGYRIFQAKSVHQIVEDVFTEGKIDATRLQWRLGGSYAPREYCVQYDEIAWSFVERLLSEEGISYVADRDDDGWTLVLYDTPKAHATIAEPSVVPFEEESGNVAAPHVFHLEREVSWTHDAVHLRDYDVAKPSTPIDGNAGSGNGEWYDYPAFTPEKSIADTLAQIRLEQLQRFADRASIESDCVRLQPGRIATLFGTSLAEHDGDWLVVELEHDVVNASPNSSVAGGYRNRGVFVPVGDAPFRPDVPERRLDVEELETAVTTGPSGEEIHVDNLGRVKLRFHWDRSGVSDDTSSTWFRTMQQNVASSMVHPRVGWEVAVGYLDGCPDRAFVLGRVYNATNTHPYAQPGASAATSLKSNTTPGGGTGNEFSAHDDGGAQKVVVNAAKDLSKAIANDLLTKIGANLMHDIGGGFQSIVTGAWTALVGGNQSDGAQKSVRIDAKGVRIEIVAGIQEWKINGTRNLETKAYIEAVSPGYGMECNQENIDVKGGNLQLVTGKYRQGAGLGIAESVMGWRKLTVTGARSISSAFAAAESAGLGSPKVKITSGNAKDKAAGKWTNTGSKEGTTTISSAAKYEAAVKVEVKGKKITLKGGSEVAAGKGTKLVLKGGKLDVDGGTLDFIADEIELHVAKVTP